MKKIVLRSDLPCAVILFDSFLYSYRKAAYFMYYDEAVAYTTLVSRFSGDIFAVVFVEVKGEFKVSYYRGGEMLMDFDIDVQFVSG